jgi:TRAP-type C4-dicarboxylate transport system substrate-binding protein
MSLHKYILYPIGIVGISNTSKEDAMKKSKVLILGFACIVLAVAFVLSSQINALAASQDTSKPIVLKYTCPWPPGSDVMKRRVELINRVAEKSHGRLKIELYGVGELCDSKGNFEAVQTGIADIAHIISSYTPGLFPRSQLLESPIFPMPAKNPWVVSYKVMSELAPEINPEFERNDVVPSGLYWLGGVVQVYSKKPLVKVEDFKGVKISCVSEVHSNSLKRLGFAPSIIPGAETYLALQKGVIDAALQTHGGARITKYNEVCNYVTLFNWPQLGFTYVFNPKSLNRLPADLRELLISEFKTWHEEVEIGQQWKANEAYVKWVQDNGIKILTLSNEESQRIRQLLPTLDEWAADQKKLGVSDAKELGQKALKLLEKYSEEYK